MIKARLVSVLFVFLLSTFVVVTNAASQVPPKAGETKPPPRKRVRPVRRPEQSDAAAANIAKSDEFLNLGDRYREKQKWNAAEAAYGEAVKLWSNPEALEELGYIYLYIGRRIPEAQRILSRLQSANPAYARDLAAEIAKVKSAR